MALGQGGFVFMIESVHRISATKLLEKHFSKCAAQTRAHQDISSCYVGKVFHSEAILRNTALNKVNKVK